MVGVLGIEPYCLGNLLVPALQDWPSYGPNRDYSTRLLVRSICIYHGKLIYGCIFSACMTSSGGFSPLVLIPSGLCRS